MEMLDLPRFKAEEGIQRCREIRMLEWIFHLRSTGSHWEGPEHTPFINTLRDKFVGWVPASLRSSVFTLLGRVDLTVGNKDHQLENLNAMEVIGSWGDRSQAAALNHQRQGGHGYHNGQQNQSSNQTSVACIDGWHWLVNGSVWRSRIDWKPTKFLLDLYKQKSARSNEQKSKLNHKNRVMAPQVIPRLKPVNRPRTPWMKWGWGPLEERSQDTTENLYC